MDTLYAPDDLRIDHVRLGDGRGALRITHLPTGIFVCRELEERPVVQMKTEMLQELRDLVGDSRR